MLQDRQPDKNNNDIWMTYQTNDDKKVVIPSSSLLHDSLISVNLLAK
ncbi:MAG: hypothetical protein WB443_05625 [Nitrososphaeraceae archaeon]